MNARVRTSRVLALLIGVGAMLALAVGLSPSSGAAPAGWHEGAHTHRFPVSVTTTAAQVDAVVEVPFDFAGNGLSPETVRVVEVDSPGGNVAAGGALVPVQVEGGNTIVFLMEGSTGSGATRHYQVYLGTDRAQSPGFIDDAGADAERVVEVSVLAATSPSNPYDVAMFQIETTAGTWYFEPNGGGFAGLVDSDGNDWISWDRDVAGEGGTFRGIPKARLDKALYGNDEGPFSPGSVDTLSEVTGGPVRATITSQSRDAATDEVDGRWVAEYEVGPRSMTFRMTTADSEWRALYQGTPGGAVDTNDQVILSGINGGNPQPLSTTVQQDLGDPEWAAFLDGPTTRSLVISASPNNTIVDRSSSRDSLITIFGFGRETEAQNSHFLTGTSHEFTYGLVDSKTAATLEARATDFRTGAISATAGALNNGNPTPDAPGATTTTTVTVPDTIPPPPLEGYRLLDRNGEVYTFGEATDLGDARQTRAGAAVDIESTPSNRGYWILDETGKVEAFGDAIDHGSLSDTSVVLVAGETVSTMSRTLDGGGYWLFTSIGRAIGFGNAGNFSDLVELGLAGQLNGPIVDSVATATGNGYWMVGSDGGVFSFGDAQFFGSMGGQVINQPVNGLVPDPDGTGYWLVAGDGGVFAFQADFRGSVPGELAPGVSLNAPVIGMVSYGNGYLMVASDGGVFNFSDLPFDGSLGGNPPNVPVVAISA